MNFADFGLGTWQPTNGFYDVANAMATLAKQLGVTIITDANVEKIIVDHKTTKGILVNKK
ncbi:phytoene dehydrogenase [Flavobacterium psychrophilum]|nr:phytoene dehydrogenase [Flavobacterium psychrophilum]